MSQVYGMPVGVYVYSVNSGSGAQQAGLRQGDIITAMDGQTVSTMDELKSMLEAYEPGDTVTLTVERIQNNGYESMEVSVILAAAGNISQ
jgi:serine protease Do